jgi:chromosome partitioning protein
MLVATLKGGSTKTTTAVLMAIALAQSGKAVVLICGDTTNRGAARWTRKAMNRGYEIPYTFLEWDTSKAPLSKFAQIAESDYDADVVIVDLGGEKPEFFAFACSWADYLISPTAPVDAELDGIGPTYESASAISGARRVGLVQSVLLTRCPQVGKGMAAEARAQLVEDRRDEYGRPDPEQSWSIGAHVFDTEVTRGAGYSDMYGHIPQNVGEYEALRVELEAILEELSEDSAEDAQSSAAAPAEPLVAI